MDSLERGPMERDSLERGSMERDPLERDTMKRGPMERVQTAGQVLDTPLDRQPEQQRYVPPSFFLPLLTLRTSNRDERCATLLGGLI